jgi:release factor glutamine methyltransferase
MIMFEIGYDQREAVENILMENGFYDIGSVKDLAGRDRVVFGRF